MTRRSRKRFCSALVDLVEEATVAEVGRGYLCPPAEQGIVDGDQRQVGEDLEVGDVGGGGVVGPVEVLCDQLLAIVAVKIIEERLVFPRDQDVPDAALGERRGGRSGPGVEHRYVAIDRANEFLLLRRVVA